MTLKNKNRIFLFLFIFSAIIFLFNITVLCIAAAAKSIVPPINPMRPFVLIPKGGLCPYNFNSSLAAIIAFSLSAPALSIAIFKGFEKTPSLEILFFSGFIISCVTESARILLPLFGFWKTNSLFLNLHWTDCCSRKISCADESFLCDSFFFRGRTSKCRTEHFYFACFNLRIRIFLPDGYDNNNFDMHSSLGF